MAAFSSPPPSRSAPSSLFLRLDPTLPGSGERQRADPRWLPLHYEPITLAEKVGTALLLAATVYIGLKPDVLLDWITPALQSPLMQAALKGGSL